MLADHQGLWANIKPALGHVTRHFESQIHILQNEVIFTFNCGHNVQIVVDDKLKNYLDLYYKIIVSPTWSCVSLHRSTTSNNLESFNLSCTKYLRHRFVRYFIFINYCTPLCWCLKYLVILAPIKFSEHKSDSWSFHSRSVTQKSLATINIRDKIPNR